MEQDDRCLGIVGGMYQVAMLEPESLASVVEITLRSLGGGPIG
jgi:hypothetical protein